MANTATKLGTVKQPGGTALSATEGDMAFAPDGTLYIDTHGDLFKCDPTLLVGTKMGVSGVGNMQITFGDNGVLYRTTGSAVYTINVNDGSATLGHAVTVAFSDLASVVS